MILLDTNILIDLFGTAGHSGAEWSRKTYGRLSSDGRFGCNVVVLAELAAEGAPKDELLLQCEMFRIELVDINVDCANTAGRAHRLYRRRGGARDRVLPDFLIAGHAEVLGAPLMTRDRRLASYFPDLTLITPETHP